MIVDYSDKYTETTSFLLSVWRNFKMEYGNGESRGSGAIGEATMLIFPGLSVCEILFILQ